MNLRRAISAALLLLLPSWAGAQGLESGLSGGLHPFGTEYAPQDSLYQGLVSYWPLNESSGTRADSVGSNSLTSNNSVPSAAGKISNAAGEFSTASSWLSKSHNASQTPGSAITVGFWLYLTNLTSTYGVIAKDIYGTNRSWIIEANSSNNGDIKFYWADTTTDAAVSFGRTNGGAFLATTWTHVAWVYDGTLTGDSNRLKCYINGTSQPTFYQNSVPASLPAGTADLEFGRRSNGIGRYLNGRLDEVGYWSRALTSAEVTRLYNSGSGRALYSFVDWFVREIGWAA